ncbi:Long-chain-fatty-acid--CoA ligase 5 [Nosema bombycis CQ1]|uniref:Long-chain-fatty-acid--CoA ligase 5 n=1 Tax=Nosema bombycis (strain CQ1 / CVCC 102059) TaxID=578461 RepID=R0KSU2_NOSB1|nr:Long-chain-fatty-acid--CoA ligase 5 [Nosema bombycis CQ1]|eukprot:EOB13292.1 Long-chain-fatty-acid--CoA ligase 5 [Nosema bombycis CQ1]
MQINKRVISSDEDKNVLHNVIYQDDIWATPDGSETLLDLFLNTSNTYSKNNFLGTIIKNKLTWQTYEEIQEKVKIISVFFNKFTEKKDIIGIFSVNRYEWLVSEYGSYMSGCINSPLYSTYGPEAISLVLNETEMKICCCSYDKARSLYEIIKEFENQHLKVLVLFDDCDSDDFLLKNYESLDVQVYFWNEYYEI